MSTRKDQPRTCPRRLLNPASQFTATPSTGAGAELQGLTSCHTSSRTSQRRPSHTIQTTPPPPTYSALRHPSNPSRLISPLLSSTTTLASKQSTVQTPHPHPFRAARKPTRYLLIPRPNRAHYQPPMTKVRGRGGRAAALPAARSSERLQVQPTSVNLHELREPEEV